MVRTAHWASGMALVAALGSGCSAKMSANAEARASARADTSSGAEASASARADADFQANSGGNFEPVPVEDGGSGDGSPATPASNNGGSYQAGGSVSWSGTSSAGYGGVIPGTGMKPDHLAAEPGTAPVITWHGFQPMPGGSSRIFVQSAQKPTTNVRRSGQGFEVVLAGVDLPAGNNRLPLVTRYFNTPVRRARIKKKGGEVVVVLDMRADVAPTVRQEKAQSGYWFTYLEFPPGNFR